MKSEVKKFEHFQLINEINSENTARQFIEAIRWRNGRKCSRCGSSKTQETTHKSMPYWCPNCRKYLSVKTGTFMEGSKIGYEKWLMAMYVFSNSSKKVSSTRLAKAVGITQTNAWFLLQRIETAWSKNINELFGVKVETR